MNKIVNKLEYELRNVKNNTEMSFINIQKYLRKDKYVFGNINRKKIVNNTVNLHYWSLDNGQENLGDYLSKVIFEWMLQKNNIQNRIKGIKHLYSVGSILGFGYQDAVVWGSGLLEDNIEYRKRIRRSKLDIRCLRGPLTRRTLVHWTDGVIDIPELYGDPVTLMPLIYKPESIEKRYNYVIIPHFLDSHMKNVYSKEGEKVKVIDMLTDNYEDVINEIVAAEKVISSSLHGIILAESYGIPAIYVKTGNSFKYEDWYLSTEREIRWVNSLEEGYKSEPMRLPNIKKLQENLFQSYPKDLWR